MSLLNVHRSPWAKVLALWWSSSSLPDISSRATFPAAARIPACFIYPPKTFRERTAWDMNSLGPASRVPTGAPKPCSAQHGLNTLHRPVQRVCVLPDTHLGEAHADGVCVLQYGGQRNALGHSSVQHPGSIHVEREAVSVRQSSDLEGQNQASGDYRNG